MAWLQPTNESPTEGNQATNDIAEGVNTKDPIDEANIANIMSLRCVQSKSQTQSGNPKKPDELMKNDVENGMADLKNHGIHIHIKSHLLT